MRKLRAIGILIVGALTLIVMPSFASAVVLGDLLVGKTEVDGHQTVYVVSPETGVFPTYIQGVFNKNDPIGASRASCNGSDPNNGTYSPVQGVDPLYWCPNDPFEDLPDGTYHMLVSYNDSTPTNYYQGTFSVENGECTDCVVDANTTRFISYSISTTTRVFSVRFYIKPSDFLTGVNLSLTVDTPVLTNWYDELVVATTSGFSGYNFQYTGSFASTTIEQFEFLAQLKGTDFAGSCNPFIDAGCAKITYDTISTSTFPGGVSPISGLTGQQIINGIEENCRPFSGWFNVPLCLNYLLFPNPQQIEKNIVDLKDNFLSRVPIGYATRFISILASTTESSLPTISYTFGTTSPLFASIGTISFDPWSAFSTSTGWTSWVSDQSTQKTLWQIMEEPVTIVVYLVLLFMIIHDITGIWKHNHPRK